MIAFPLITAVFPVVRAATAPDEELAAWITEYKKLTGVDPDHQTPDERLRLTWDSVLSQKNWEWDMVYMAFTCSFVGGFAIGAQLKNEENKLAVIRQYSEVQFDHPFLAQRKMRDRHLLQNVRNGLKFGVRVALFSSLLSFGTLSSLSYRNYVNPLDIAGTAALTGAVWKWQRGPKGMLVSAAVAGSFGLFAGCLFWTAMKMSGYTVSEYRLMRGGDYFQREMAGKKEVIKEYGNKQALEVLQERDMMLHQRRYDEKMKQHEAELAAKQEELANTAKATT